MPVAKEKARTLALQQRIKFVEANDLLIKFLINGHIIDPADLDLPSFEPQALECEKFEQAGNENELLMYSAQRYISNKNRLLPVEVKIYFLPKQVTTNGFGIFGSMRLHSFLKTSAFMLKDRSIAIQMYFSEDFREGALVFSNGVVMRFSDKTNSFKNFHINTAESNSIGNETFSFQKASLTSIDLLYEKCSYEDLKNCRSNKKPAIFKLLKVLSKLNR